MILLPQKEKMIYTVIAFDLNTRDMGDILWIKYLGIADISQFWHFCVLSDGLWPIRLLK